MVCSVRGGFHAPSTLDDQHAIDVDGSRRQAPAMIAWTPQPRGEDTPDPRTLMTRCGTSSNPVKRPSCQGAVGAGAEDLNVVGDPHEAVLGTDLFRPSLYGWAFDLHRASAVAADEVVVVTGGAAAVDGLTVPGAQYVHLSSVGQRLQRPIDGRQANGVAARAQDRVNVLCAPKVVDLVEDRGDRRALLGGPGPGRAVLAYHVISLLPRRAPCRSGLTVGQPDGNLVLIDLGLGRPASANDRGEYANQGESGDS